MDFMAAPLSVKDTSEHFYVPDQSPRSLVLCGLDQHGPIFA